MKKLMLIAMGLMVLGTSHVWAQTGGTTPAPQVYTITGANDVELAATLFPEFTDFPSTDNKACTDRLKKRYPEGMSSAPRWLVPALTNMSSKPVDAIMGNDFKLKVSIPSDYRKTAKIMVNWSVRIEGYTGSAVRIWPQLCSPFHGVSVQTFAAGDVVTKLYVNGKSFGQSAVITLPSAGVETSSQPSDPTIQGSYVITAKDFGGTLPATLDVEVRWANDSCMLARSPANERTLTATVQYRQ